MRVLGANALPGPWQRVLEVLTPLGNSSYEHEMHHCSRSINGSRELVRGARAEGLSMVEIHVGFALPRLKQSKVLPRCRQRMPTSRGPGRLSATPFNVTYRNATDGEPGCTQRQSGVRLVSSKFNNKLTQVLEQ